MSDSYRMAENLSPNKRTLLEMLLEEKKKDNGVQRTQAIDRRRDDTPLPVSFSQQRMWLSDQLEPNSPAYNIPCSVRLTGTLNVQALRSGLNEIVRRHEVLRTTYETVDGQPIQIIAPSQVMPLPVIDLGAVPEIEREQEADRMVMEEAQRPFDLARGPLLRIALPRLAADEHILLLTMQHIISDDWSIGAFIQEIATLYEAFSTGKPSPLAELPIQYADYAYWQRQWLRGEVLRSQVSYWKQQLAGAPPFLELLADHPRRLVQTRRGAHEVLVIPEALTEALRTLSRQKGTTLFMTLIAALNILLYRYTNQEDILVGSPIANRNQVETHGLIGFFANTLVLRTDLSGNPTFRETLGRVRKVALGAYSHQDVPFEMLVEELQQERDPSRSPIFQVMFSLHSNPVPVMTFSEVTMRPLIVGNATVNFDIGLSVEEEPKKLVATLDYNPDLFDKTTIARMLKHLHRILEASATNPDQPIARMPLITEAEARHLLVDCNDTDTNDESVCLHQLIEAQAERTPGAVAIVFGPDHLTFRDLNRRANQLAQYLRTIEVRPDDVVGVYMERSLEMVVALLGLLKADAAYMPLDPEYPKHRLHFLIEDAKASVLLTQARLANDLYDESARVICMDTDWPRISEESDQNQASGVTPDNMAYVIYTSGSTGQPKGVMICHVSICNTLRWRERTFSLTGADCILQNIAFAFDPSVWQIFGALMSGARLLMAQPGGHKDPAYLVREIAEQNVTIVDFSPPMLRAFLDEEGLERCVTLKQVFCGGEALSAELQNRFFDGLPAKLYNVYGPTETAVDATSWSCTREGGRGFVPIGRPISNKQVYLLDSQLQPIPIGLPGELHIGGVGLARGYLNGPAFTAERFIPNPFARRAGARLYKTGDLARYHSDGTIGFLGRIDNQTKIRGHRIERGEIEAVLADHASVKEVIVVDQEDAVGQKCLIAYFVPYQATSATLQTQSDGLEEPLASDSLASIVPQLYDFLKERLPIYMVPSAFVEIGAIPLLPNGKIDRRALPAPESKGLESKSSYTTPRSELEQTIVNIWKEVLPVETIGVTDNFFELGGHSILGVKVLHSVREALGVELEMRNIFESPTVAGLADAVVQARQSDVESDASAVMPVSRESYVLKVSRKG